MMRIALTIPAMALVAVALTGCELANTFPFLNPSDSSATSTAANDKAIADPPAPAAGQASATPAEPVLTGVDRVISRVHKGNFLCAGAVSVNVAEAPGNPREFVVQGKNFKHQMIPVVTASGAIRLENQANGIVWLQVGKQAMLMNQTKGQRLAAECVPKE
ncbi:hypothetical protein E9531_16195 [Lampropedia puyangensis]|uniref:C-type lysozyme inhibitor domain-containing protein n=1 Tax=Lampropedia puyangensis TaxID=1330072 RepID=A0A4S8ESG2_9BURK|nr:hypothetical protein [Lampropedia puyangensis]THT96434.1 hypothetical protein E9531_16195 [Lampropedia puyangensis]